jgi:5'-nucleotidase
MTDILLTNDDGYNSAGFLPLLKELSKEFSVVAVTPDKERSWIGKAITSTEVVKVNKVRLHDFDIYTINGTPADCVQMGLFNILSSYPKMVVSGINQGVNIGHARILSSGTVGAAIEASIQGVKALATSLMIPVEIKKKLDLFDEKNSSVFENAAKISAKITGILMNKTFDDIDVFSMNIPYGATIHSTLTMTKPFRESYGRLFYIKDDGFSLQTPDLIFEHMQDNSDLKALYEDNISLTPLRLDLTSNESLKQVERQIGKSWEDII